MGKRIPFEHSSIFEENKKPLLGFLAISAPQESAVSKVTIHLPIKGGTDQDFDRYSFYPEEKKFWSMAFCQYLVVLFDIQEVSLGNQFCYRTEITEEMVSTARSFFNLPEDHEGFYSVFLQGESIEIYTTTKV